LTSITLAVIAMLAGSVTQALAVGTEKTTICHISGNGSGSTISVPSNGSGEGSLTHHLVNHEHDHVGACTIEESTDSDKDGISDAFDSCPNDATNTCLNPIDTSSPVITEHVTCAVPGNAGWCRGDVTVTFTVTDNESAITSANGCSEQKITSDVEGKVFTCTATSQGGTNSLSVTVNRDATSPSISSGEQSPKANENGWNNSNVDVTFACTDSLSGVVSDSDSGNVSSEGKNQSVTGNCEDNAGNTSSTVYSGINIDLTNPSISSGEQSPKANENGWNNSNVDVTFACTDSLSGVVSDSDKENVIAEGQGQSVTGQCKDKAGNTNSATYGGINIDMTAPIVNVQSNLDFMLGQPVSFTCSDELSGVATCNGNIDTNKPGQTQQNVSTTDKAGNIGSNALTIQVNYDLKCGSGSGSFLSPVPNTSYKSGRVVPEKIVACDYMGKIVPTAIAQSYVDGVAAVGTGNANEGNYFRFDSVDQQYIFNLSSKGFTVAKHTLSASLDSGQIISVVVNFTK